MGGIHRLKNTAYDRYAVTPMTILEDPLLSWRAKGLFAYLNSRPDGWIIQQADLTARSREGREAVEKAVRELRERGYLVIQMDRDAQGRIAGKTWELKMEGSQNAETQAEPPYNQKTVTRFFHPTGNPQLTNNNTKSNQDKKNKGLLAFKSDKAACTLSLDWALTPEQQDWTRAKAPALDVELELEQFKAYHTAKGSKMKDWAAAWRTWVLNAVKWQGQKGPVSKANSATTRRPQQGTPAEHREWLNAQECGCSACLAQMQRDKAALNAMAQGNWGGGF